MNHAVQETEHMDEEDNDEKRRNKLKSKVGMHLYGDIYVEKEQEGGGIENLLKRNNAKAMNKKYTPLESQYVELRKIILVYYW